MGLTFWQCAGLLGSCASRWCENLSNIHLLPYLLKLPSTRVEHETYLTLGPPRTCVFFTTGPWERIWNSIHFYGGYDVPNDTHFWRERCESWPFRDVPDKCLSLFFSSQASCWSLQIWATLVVSWSWILCICILRNTSPPIGSMGLTIFTYIYHTAY